MATLAEPEFLTVDETAELFRVDKRTIYRRLEDGTIPHIRLGLKYRIPRDVVERMLSAA